MENKLDINYIIEDSEEINIRELRKRAGMSREQFCGYFRIPYRTLQSWELGERDTPIYVKRLLMYVIRINELMENGRLILSEESGQEGEGYGGEEK